MNKRTLSVFVIVWAVAGCSGQAAVTAEATTRSSPPPESAAPTALPPTHNPDQTAEPAPNTPQPDQTRETDAAADEATVHSEISPAEEHPLIVSFTADPDEIDPGDEIRLTWETRAEAVTLCTTERGGPLSTCANLPGSGTWDVETDELDREYEMFILFAEAGDVSDQQSATVTIRCPTTWFFEDAPPGCPYASVHSQGAIQRFEQGTMIWVGGLDTIFVIYADGDSPYWDRFNDAWDSSMPESDPDLVPPTGLLQPVRGFGLVWRGPEGATIRVRERLGWASGPEAALDTVYQCDSAPKYNTCYLQDEQGILVLEPERSGWQYYEGSP